MSYVDVNQPLGTPTWMDLAVSDLEAAKSFYGAIFGWEFRAGEAGTDCLLRDQPVAGLREGPGSGWDVYLAVDDCDAVTKRVLAEGGTVLREPGEFGDLARTAFAIDPAGTRFGLWQGRTSPGCRLVNEPDTLVRNDIVTAQPVAARAFYSSVFEFTLDGNEDLPRFDFTFLRRPDGHEVGGILGLAEAPASTWSTTFEVVDTDATLAKVLAAGGSSATPEDTPYGRSATITDPFGYEFSVIARPPLA